MSIIIDGITYDIGVKSMKRTADFLDKFAERTEDGGLRRELIGVYFNYQLEFVQTDDVVEYARLWDKLTEPEEFHTVVVPDEKGSLSFSAYFSGVGDDFHKISGTQAFMKTLKVNFTAQNPARR